ncbi:MAG: cell division protein ZapA [Elusimicrobiota bacterium]
MNDKVEVQIGTRRLIVEMEGWMPIEINALAQEVSERVIEMQRHNSNVADTSKIALLVALSFAAELNRERSAHNTTRRILENKAESLSQSLRESLQAGVDPKK